LAVIGLTVRARSARYRSLARFARSQGLLDAIPFDYAPTLPQKSLERRPFPPELLPVYLEAMDAAARPLWLMLALTGERLTAIASLQHKDVTEDDFSVTIKGGDRRTILLTPPTRSVIQQAGEYAKANGFKSDYVFLNQRGRPWTADWMAHYLKKMWKRELEPKGVPYFTAHTLRHMVGDTAGALNFQRDMIQAALGHKSSQTADHYVHPEAKRARKVHTAVHATVMQHIGRFLPVDATVETKEDQEISCPECGCKFHAEQGLMVQAGE